MGKLSDTDKFAIEGMMSNGMSVEDIKEHFNLGARSRVVENYIEERFPPAEPEVLEEKEEIPEPTVPRNEKMIEQAINATAVQLNDKHLAKELVDRAWSRLEKKEPPSWKHLSRMSLKLLNAGHLMSMKTASGASRPGLAMMTGAASERIDESKNKHKPKPNPNIWSPKTGRPVHEE